MPLRLELLGMNHDFLADTLRPSPPEVIE
jgi:hypothetical protein